MGKLDESAAQLAQALALLGTGHLVVVTGAGISLASGIPTFRGTDPGAVWARDVTEMGTFDFFRRHPVASWRWYLDRFDVVLDSLPNAAHRALADLERWHADRGGRFLLVTQNVDPLHERAGSQRLIKVHGSADRVRCASTGCRHGEPRGSLSRSQVDLASFRAEPTVDNLPRCPQCGNFLRQHVLGFDEFYDAHDSYGWPEVQEAALTADLLLFVGTSFSVGVTELFRQAAVARRTPVISIDPGAEATRFAGLLTLTEPAETLLPRVLQLISGEAAQEPRRDSDSPS